MQRALLGLLTLSAFTIAAGTSILTHSVGATTFYLVGLLIGWRIAKTSSIKPHRQHSPPPESRGLSHDIRTPLAGIIGTTELLRRHPEAKPLAQLLDTLSMSCTNLEVVVLDLLEVTATESVPSTIHPAPTDLNDLCELLVHTLREKAAERGQTIRAVISPTVPRVAKIDRVRSYQFLHRYLSNFLRALPENTLLNLSLSSPEAAERADSALLSCSLSSAIDLPEITSPFSTEQLQLSLGATTQRQSSNTFSISIPFRGEPTSEQHASLTDEDIIIVTDSEEIRLYLAEHIKALGMSRWTAISASEASLLPFNIGGAKKFIVHLDSDSAEFRRLVSVFLDEANVCAVCLVDSLDEHARKTLLEYGIDSYLLYPFGGSKLRTVLSIPHATTMGKQARGSSINVLVVDDVRVNRLVLSKHLELAGHTVVTATNGEEAIERIAKTGHFTPTDSNNFDAPFDIVIMDIDMPVLGGLAATERIRELEQELTHAGIIRHIPIIAATADAVGNDYEKFILAGMEWFIVKPIDPNRLLQLVQHFGGLGGRRVGTGDSFEDAIDLPWLYSQFGGDEDIVLEIIGAFLDEIDSLWLSLLKGSLDGGAERIRAGAHAIKGSLQNVGARGAAELAFDIETCAKNAILSDIREKIEALSKQIRHSKECAMRIHADLSPKHAGSAALAGKPPL